MGWNLRAFLSRSRTWSPPPRLGFFLLPTQPDTHSSTLLLLAELAHGDEEDILPLPVALPHIAVAAAVTVQHLRLGSTPLVSAPPRRIGAGDDASVKCHQVRVEHELSSSRRGTESAISPGLLAHGNLDTSSPDMYRAPPAPLPYDINLLSSQTLPQTGSKIDQVPLNESQPLRENISGSIFEGCMNLESNHKKKSFSEHGSPKVAENKNTKFSVSVISSTEEEDVCPTCLEEYDADNPCITTKCNHHFHLSCILEWMERSDTCPICGQLMVIAYTFDE